MGIGSLLRKFIGLKINKVQMHMEKSRPVKRHGVLTVMRAQLKMHFV